MMRGRGGRGRGGRFAAGQRPVSEGNRISIADQLAGFQASEETGNALSHGVPHMTMTSASRFWSDCRILVRCRFEQPRPCYSALRVQKIWLHLQELRVRGRPFLNYQLRSQKCRYVLDRRRVSQSQRCFLQKGTGKGCDSLQSKGISFTSRQCLRPHLSAIVHHLVESAFQGKSKSASCCHVATRCEHQLQATCWSKAHGSVCLYMLKSVKHANRYRSWQHPVSASDD